MSGDIPVHAYREMLIIAGATGTQVDALIAAAKREAREEAWSDIAKLLTGKLEAAEEPPVKAPSDAGSLWDRRGYVAPVRDSATSLKRTMTLPILKGGVSPLPSGEKPTPPRGWPGYPLEPPVPPDVPRAPARKPVSSWSRAWRGFWQVRT